MGTATRPTETKTSGKSSSRRGRTRAVKLTVALPEDAIEIVERLAEKSGKTKTQILREAITLKNFIETEVATEGTRLLLERDGVTREIVFTS